MHTSTDVFAKVRDHDRADLLAAARAADVLPYFRRLESPAAPVVEMEGAERIMLGSNNYLGLTGDPRVMQGARDALERYGTGLTGSRLLNGTIDLHLELESELAAWMGTEDAIVFTTGHQANLGTWTRDNNLRLTWAMSQKSKLNSGPPRRLARRSRAPTRSDAWASGSGPR